MSPLKRGFLAIGLVGSVFFAIWAAQASEEGQHVEPPLETEEVVTASTTAAEVVESTTDEEESLFSRVSKSWNFIVKNDPSEILAKTEEDIERRLSDIADREASLNSREDELAVRYSQVDRQASDVQSVTRNLQACIADATSASSYWSGGGEE